MILTVAVALFAIGLVTWLVGAYFSYTGIAAIGAVIVLGVGAAVATDGLQYASGQVENETANNTTEVDMQYTEADLGSLPIGAIVVILGALLFIQPLNEVFS